jgi:Putative phage metallopeptidase
MKTYSPAPKEVGQRVARLVQKYHPDLTIVKIDCVSAATDQVGQPAITHQGYPADGQARIIGPKDRAMGRGDCEILIDEEKFNKMTAEQKDALLDHELQHFEVQKNKYKQVKRDPQKRPKLKIRLHDAQFGWFAIIAQRHGLASAECRQAANLLLSGRQTYFAFVEDLKVAKGISTAELETLPA